MRHEVKQIWKEGEQKGEIGDLVLCKNVLEEPVRSAIEEEASEKLRKVFFYIRTINTPFMYWLISVSHVLVPLLPQFYTSGFHLN